MSHVMDTTRERLHAATDWKAGAFAGLIASVVFLMVEMALVWMVQGMSPWAPTYMMAAMALGENVLPPMGTWATFDLGIVMIAMLVHFPLAVVLGVAGAWLMHRFDLAAATLVGAGLGLAVYLISFHVVAPLAFPWFVMAQNWISVFAHIVFGAVIGIAYIAIRNPGDADSPRLS